jgi:hypothetical protein
VALAVADAVHLVYPPYRMLVNVSMEMQLMRFVPQVVLDATVGWLFGRTVL